MKSQCLIGPSTLATERITVCKFHHLMVAEYKRIKNAYTYELLLLHVTILVKNTYFVSKLVLLSPDKLELYSSNNNKQSNPSIIVTVSL